MSRGIGEKNENEFIKVPGGKSYIFHLWLDIMARDFFGNIIREDIFGIKVSKKQIRRDVLQENKINGKSAESFKFQAALHGKEVERSPHGKDFIVRDRDIITGRVRKTTYVEVKSSSTAPLSPLQKKTKKGKSNYKVVRESGFW